MNLKIKRKLRLFKSQKEVITKEKVIYHSFMLRVHLRPIHASITS